MIMLFTKQIDSEDSLLGLDRYSLDRFEVKAGVELVQHADRDRKWEDVTSTSTINTKTAPAYREQIWKSSFSAGSDGNVVGLNSDTMGSCVDSTPMVAVKFEAIMDNCGPDRACLLWLEKLKRHDYCSDSTLQWKTAQRSQFHTEHFITLSLPWPNKNRSFLLMSMLRTLENGTTILSLRTIQESEPLGSTFYSSWMKERSWENGELRQWQRATPKWDPRESGGTVAPPFRGVVYFALPCHAWPLPPLAAECRSNS